MNDIAAYNSIKDTIPDERENGDGSALYDDDGKEDCDHCLKSEDVNVLRDEIKTLRSKIRTLGTIAYDLHHASTLRSSRSVRSAHYLNEKLIHEARTSIRDCLPPCQQFENSISEEDIKVRTRLLEVEAANDRVNKSFMYFGSHVYRKLSKVEEKSETYKGIQYNRSWQRSGNIILAGCTMYIFWHCCGYFTALDWVFFNAVLVHVM